MIDIHTHVVPEHFPQPPNAGCGGWPCMRHSGGGAMLAIGGKDVRQLDARSWDVDTRLAAMDVEGADVHALSPMPDLLGYGLGADDALALARAVNTAIASMVRRAPARFVGLGTVPLQDIDLAVAELPRLKHALGLVGIEAGAFIGGEPLGSPRFLPLFEALEALDLALFVHPVRTGLATSPCGLPTELAVNLIDYPIDQGRCVTAFLGKAIRTRVPELRVAFAHGGGSFATILPRLQVAWQRNARAAALFGASPIELARSFFYDTLVYEPPLLRMLVDLLGADALCIGSDEPFEIRQPRPADRLDALGLLPADRAAILAGNARRFLGMTP